MYWQDEQDSTGNFEVPEDVQDFLFKIKCQTLPLDHGYSLSQQIMKQLPWIKDEPLAAIHQIHVAESANGWMRPQDPETEVLCVSRRTKMTLRLPVTRSGDARALIGKQLDIEGHALSVGEFSMRKLSRLTTLFARYMDTQGESDEAQFLESMHRQLLQKGIKVKKMMSGRLLTHQTREGPVLTRKLMLSDLDVQQSVLLQETGLGDRQLMGMGIFLPHKGIDAVNKKQE